MTSIMLILQAILPQHFLSRAAGFVADLDRPIWLKNTLIRFFIGTYKVDLSEAECSDYKSFKNFNAFFTRSISLDRRPIAGSEWCQSADGVLSQRGTVENGNIIQAKGHTYSVQSLLAGTEAEANLYSNGSFATTYLSPKDYHRVHMPIDGILLMTRYVPGDLFSVNEATVDRVDRLFTKNERMVCVFSTEKGQIAMVLVGAMIVAGISTVWGGLEPRPRNLISSTSWPSDQAPVLKKGQEMGRFFLGSTVVLLTEIGGLSWSVDAGAFVRVRSPLAE